MKLRIAGINHNDVLGSTRLLKWLREVKESEEDPPHFVAVEYDPVMFEDIQGQRPELRMRAKEAWPGSPESVLDAIENSLGLAICTDAYFQMLRPYHASIVEGRMVRLLEASPPRDERERIECQVAVLEP